jgi:hypothetical protein
MQHVCKISIYFCNIDVKHLQHTPKISETLKTYGYNMHFQCNVTWLLGWMDASSLRSSRWRRIELTGDPAEALCHPGRPRARGRGQRARWHARWAPWRATPAGQAPLGREIFLKRRGWERADDVLASGKPRPSIRTSSIEHYRFAYICSNLRFFNSSQNKIFILFLARREYHLV